ncbi:MAG: O-antigen ligase family protein [Negativicutes bacterium]|nr:O-antigen ligase family protein [Negativicutes bacterium]
MNISSITPVSCRLPDLTEYCILAVAFFLPLSLNVASLFLAGATLAWIRKMIVARRLELRHSPFDIAVILFVILSAASIWGSPNRDFSFYNYYHLMGRYVVLYYLVINNIRSASQVRRLITTVLVSAAVVAAFGFYQYIHGIDTSAFQWVDGEQFPELKVRVFSTLKNPNLLAAFLVVIMAIATGLGLSTRSLAGKILCFGFVLVLGVCLALTYSRGAWICVLAVIAVFGVLKNKKVFWLLALLPVAIMLVGHEVFLERLLSIMNPTDTSSTLRLALWESTVAMIEDNPWFGIGWGAYWMVYPEYDFFVLNASTKIFHAHNMYLNIAAEIGIPGLLAFLAILVGHTHRAFVLLHRATDRWTRGLMLGIFAALLAIVISGFTDYVLFSMQMAMVFWLLNALVVVVSLDQPLR